MFKRKNFLGEKIDKLIDLMEKANINDLSYILGSKKEIVRRNFLAGIFRGMGIGIGVTVITAILVILLRKVVALNLPIIGQFIADIVEIVERSR